MRRITLLLVLTALFPVFAPANGAEAPAQGDNPAAQATMDTGLLQSLQNHLWALAVATDGENRRIDALFPTAGRPYTFTFTASMLNVQGGCNTFGGGYRINARGQLETGQMRSTMIACEPALMQADAAPAIYILDLIVETETVPQ